MVQYLRRNAPNDDILDRVPQGEHVRRLAVKSFLDMDIQQRLEGDDHRSGNFIRIVANFSDFAPYPDKNLDVFVVDGLKMSKRSHICYLVSGDIQFFV